MIQVEKIWTTETAVWIRTIDGREACELFADYPRLKFASTEVRNNYQADNFGIHWPDVDEDLCFEGFFNDKNRNALYNIFTEHPYLNAAAIARRMGMKQSLLAAYISGTKRPSKEREAQIIETVRSIGRELIAV